MVTVRNKNDIAGAAEEFNDVFSEAGTRAARFYTLYYIEQEMDVNGYDFYFKETKDRQADAFFNYAIFATGLELRHYRSKYRVANHVMGNVLKGADKQSPKESSNIREIPKSSLANAMVEIVREAIDENVPIELKDRVERMMLKQNLSVDKPGNIEDVIRICETLEERHNAFTEPEEYLKACKHIFNDKWLVEYIDKNTEPVANPGEGEMNGREWLNYEIKTEITEKDFNEAMGWRFGFGGKAWAGVPKTALLKDELSKTAFIDLMWSVEHNGGNFVDKVPIVKDSDVEVIHDYLLQEWEEYDKNVYRLPTEPERLKIGSKYKKEILPSILQSARDENIRPLWEIASSAFTDIRSRRVLDSMFPRKYYLIESEDMSVEFGS